MGTTLSRRALLGAIPAALLAEKRGDTFPAEAVRYADAATEFPVTRITDPKSNSSWLPPTWARCASRKNEFVVYASDRAGSPQVFRTEWKGGQSRQLTEAQSLDIRSVSLTPDDRSVFYIDGDSVWSASTGGAAPRVIYKAPSGFLPTGGIGISDDGRQVWFIEKRGPVHRLAVLALTAARTAPTAAYLLSGEEPLADPQIGPRGFLIRRNDIWQIVAPDGKPVNFGTRAALRTGPDPRVSAGVQTDSRANSASEPNPERERVGAATRPIPRTNSLPTPPGLTGQALWGPDGSSIFYLHTAEGKRTALRELGLNGGDRQVAMTTQYAEFARNRDASVFVGISGSVAAPYVLILVRSVGRELTVCEHKVSSGFLAAPRFTPNSQRILFGSDLHGKPAIYAMSVERLVEQTEEA